ncbi:hypothetical protein OROMI_004570 [Orobanche minor]
MRLPTSKLRRCWPPAPPPPLQHFVCHYTSSSTPHSSRSLFSRPIHHLHHHKGHRSCNTEWSPELRSLSPGDFASSARRFSTEPNFSELDEPIFPVQTIISMLDSYHDVTGFPWWIIISSSTVVMRLALFPSVVLQLKKLRRIGDLLPKLPPPFPPPLSGRSFRDQFALFVKEKKAAGCPSVFWFFSSFIIQVPCFFLMLMSVRRMSLDHHPGFDTLSFQKSTFEQAPGSLRLLAKIYKTYLQVMTLPIMIATLNVPQGSLVYWLTNSSLSLIQLLCLRHPRFLEYLGLPTTNAPVVAPSIKERANSGFADIVILTKQGEVPAPSLSPAELVSYSVKILTDGHKETAIRLLRLALEKDPGFVRALLILGQTLLQNKQFSEAAECLENAISKLLETGYPTEVEDVDLLILSSQWAGIANVHQGKMEEGLMHLERIARLEEPQDSKSKAHYYDGLIILASTLLIVDRKADSLKYLQKAIAYDPAYTVYLEHLESDPNNIASDLASSRREL